MAEPTCDHLWTMFCQGNWRWVGRLVPGPPYWRVDICVHCYAKRERADG